MKSHRILPLLATLALLALLLCPVDAAAPEITPEAQFCFSASDFAAPEQALAGIVVTGLPDRAVGQLTLGTRTVRTGDVLPAAALDALTLSPMPDADAVAQIRYLPVSDGAVGAERQLEVLIRPERNTAPVASDSSAETYKNISVNDRLRVTDAEGDPLTYTLTAPPKRGTVTLREDGTFSYTPKKNKVGEDAFSYTATDVAGNTSEPATVKITIRKPSGKQTYADMEQDPDLFYAVWMRERGLLSGERVAGVRCFHPETTVSRGEFLAMVMQLLEIPADDTALSTGFTDEADAPAWMQPYLAAGLRSGMISGVSSPEGLVFLPNAAITEAEACVILENTLKLPTSAAALDAEISAPAWARASVSALSEAGILEASADTCRPLTRRACARLLYAVGRAASSDRTHGLLSWAAQ